MWSGLRLFIELSAPSAGGPFAFSAPTTSAPTTLRILAEPQHLEAVSQLVATALIECAETRHTSWDLLELAGVKEDEPSVQHLSGMFYAEGHAVHESDLESAWKVDLPDDWQSYFSQVDKRFRRILKKLEKELIDTGKAQFFEVTNQSEFDHGWEILSICTKDVVSRSGSPAALQMHASEGFSRPPHAALQAGELRLHWSELENRPLAASIRFQEQRFEHVSNWCGTGVDGVSSRAFANYVSYQTSHRKRRARC